MAEYMIEEVNNGVKKEHILHIKENDNTTKIKLDNYCYNVGIFVPNKRSDDQVDFESLEEELDKLGQALNNSETYIEYMVIQDDLDYATVTQEIEYRFKDKEELNNVFIVCSAHLLSNKVLQRLLQSSRQSNFRFIVLFDRTVKKVDATVIERDDLVKLNHGYMLQYLIDLGDLKDIEVFTTNQVKEHLKERMNCE